MKHKEIDLLLPEGDFQSQVLEFEPKDITTLKEIYDGWRHLSMNLNKVDARSVNLPEGLSETAFCLAKNMCRVTKNISGANSSFDCYDLNGERHKNRIQVKACSVLPDLTSFGPRSEWDRIFFVDFFRNGDWDGTFDVYEIDTDDVNNFYVNSYETVADQKAQNRRPRFSIFNGLILENKYISKETFKIESDRIIEMK